MGRTRVSGGEGRFYDKITTWGGNESREQKRSFKQSCDKERRESYVEQ